MKQSKVWQHHGLKTPLLVDAGLKVAEKYSAIQNILGKKIIHRTVVLIDQQGIIRYYHRGMPSPKEIIAAAQTV
jgi:peroxiredoxin